MISLLKRLWNDRSGNTLVLTAAAMPVLLGAAGLATDTIQWALWKRELQRAADSAAVAGVYTRTKVDALTDVQTAVCADITRTLGRSDRTMANLVNNCPTPGLPADNASTGAEDQVSVTLQLRKSLAFSSMFMSSAPLIQASATAASFRQADEYCVVALDTIGTGIEVTGSTDVRLGNCSLIANSSDSSRAASNGTNNAVSSGNNSNITAKSLAAVGFVQKNTNWTVQSYDPGATAIADPLAGKSVPPLSMCNKEIVPTGNGSNAVLFGAANMNRTSTDVTLADGTVLAAPTGTSNSNANVDTAGQIVCIRNGTQGNSYRGVTIGAKIVLGPATYVIDGGDLTMNSTNSHIQCTGCTIILTNFADPTQTGSIKITGGTLAIAAPTTSTNSNAAYNYQGIAFMQDRSATDSRPTNPQNTIQGNNGTSVQGAVYIPSQALKFTGGSATASACLQIVAKRTTFTGNSSMQVMANCAGKGMTAITGGNTARKVRLVA